MLPERTYNLCGTTTSPDWFHADASSSSSSWVSAMSPNRLFETKLTDATGATVAVAVAVGEGVVPADGDDWELVAVAGTVAPRDICVI